MIFSISEKLQESGPEWRSFTQDEHGDRARAGAPTSFEKSFGENHSLSSSPSSIARLGIVS